MRAKRNSFSFDFMFNIYLHIFISFTFHIRMIHLESRVTRNFILGIDRNCYILPFAIFHGVSSTSSFYARSTATSYENRLVPEDFAFIYIYIMDLKILQLTRLQILNCPFVFILVKYFLGINFSLFERRATIKRKRRNNNNKLRNSHENAVCTNSKSHWIWCS